MIKSLLVILDKSKSSESAKKLSVNLAKAHKGTLTGIGILDAPWLTTPEAIPLGGVAFKVDLDAQVLEKARHKVHAIEQNFVNYCTKQEISASIIDAAGIPYEEIEYFSTEFDALVIGKDANFHFTPSEEVTTPVKKILKDSPRPIFVTSPNLPNQENPQVLIAFDGTLASSKALHIAILMGVLKDKIIHIASVHENEERVRYRVNNALKLCKNHGLTAHVHPVVSAQKPSHALLNLISDLKPSLIVMGAYGHSGIRSFFMGSCTKDLLQETHIPLFVFH